MSHSFRIVLILLCLAPLGAAQATITVNTNSGGRNVAGACALRDAIAAVNYAAAQGGCPAGQPNETIVLPAGAVIILSGPDTDSANAGLPRLAKGKTLVVEGQGATISRSTAVSCSRDKIDDPAKIRLIEVAGDNAGWATLTLRNLKLQFGCAAGVGARTYGGAIFSDGRLTLDHVTLSNNQATAFGGAIYQSYYGRVTMLDSTAVSNIGGSGGALFVNGGDVDVQRSLFQLNAVFEDFDLGNVAEGAAIFCARIGPQQLSSLTNVTVAGNLEFSAQKLGGALFASNGCHLDVSFSTLAGNSARALAGAGGGEIGLNNTIVSGNSPSNCVNIAGVHSGRNIISDATCLASFINGEDLTNTDPLLAPLADNGGPSRTMRPNAGSRAIDGALECFYLGAPVNPIDQRGFRRPDGADCDIGAYELQYALLLFSDSYER